ncbi:MAG: hypothetical protein U5L76_06040 [Patescibacteria group bacterium]|nr:hypothetical protein [Patescibacteria group bacterium]
MSEHKKIAKRCEFLAKTNLDLQQQIIALNDRFIEVCKDKIELIDEKKELEDLLREKRGGN